MAQGGTSTLPVDDSVPRSPAAVRMQSVVFARGLAALFVLFHHAGRLAAQPRFFDAQAFGGIYERINGINYFFVVSGFFIGWVNWDSIGKGYQGRKFFSKRMARIYPIYWIILIPHIIIYTTIASAGHPYQKNIYDIILSIFLIPHENQPIYGVAWTLVHELLFCIVFSIIIFFGKRSLFILPLWAISIISMNIMNDYMKFPYNYFFNSVNLCFIMGLATSRIAKKFKPNLPMLWIACGAISYCGYMIFGSVFHLSEFYENCILGLSVCVLLLGLIEQERRKPIRFHPVLLAFGAASFSIYLIHPVALSVMTNLASRLPRAIMPPVEVVIVLLSIAAVILGMLFERYVEIPVSRLVRPRLEAILEWPFNLVMPRKASSDRKMVSTGPGDVESKGQMEHGPA
ncbi:acyltransferase family protein [Sphingobium sp.]|uniref:acyltransferase family protein n=1 Tax=Sphingobium sp. TaxID=1912891 RepID=UPI003B3A2C0B